MTNPRGVSDPDLPGGPYYNKPIPPKPALPGGGGGPPPFIADTIADQAIPLPIVYGTMKVAAKLIEKYQPQSGNPDPWQSVVSTAPGVFCSSDGSAWKCIGRSDGSPGNGTSGGTPPSGTASPFHDGGMDWQWIQQLPCPVYYQRFVAALCEGEISGEQGLWWDKEKLATVTAKGLILYTGPDGSNQNLLTASGAYDSSGYQHTALVAAASTAQLRCFTGTQAELPDIAVEVIGVKFGASTPDASPADVVNDILTSFRRGAGWPSSRVDTSITGTGAGDFRVYCDAAGFRFSMLLDSQRTAFALLADILTATNSDAVWSQGKLKIKPLGDTAIASPVYGATGYVPANAAVYNLGPDDFLDRDQPVQWDHVDDADTYNRWPVQYVDRQLGYVQTTVDFPDQADADLRGVRDFGTVNLPVCFPDGTQATMISKILAQRSLRVRNTYRFRLDWRYILLEPTDVVTLTDSFTGLLGTPVRITEMQEQDDGTLLFTAEDYPAGVAAATGYQPQTGLGYVSNDVSTTASVPTSIDGTHAGIKDGIVTDASGTRSSLADNIFPNPGSEFDPPAGANALTAEWAGRVSADPRAFSGLMVRQLSAAIHAPVLLGDKLASPQADQSQLGYFVPCAPGDQFYIEAQAKFLNGVSGEQAGVWTWFLDANNSLLAGASTFTAIAASASLSDSDSFLSNGGGETGTLGAQATGWTLGGGNGLLIANDFFKVGTKSLKIVNPVAANSFSSQDVALVGGVEYVVSGWIKTTALSGGYAIFNLDIQSGITSFSILEKTTIGADPSATAPDCGIAGDGAAHDWTFIQCRFKPLASGTVRLYCQLGYAGNQTGTAWFDDVKLGPAYAKVTAQGTAPSGAVKAMLGLWSNCSLGASTAQFDALYARRADIAPLDHARTTISPYVLSTGWARILRALDGEASTTGASTSGLAFYRGNNDPTLSGGAPTIQDGTNGERLTINSWGGTKTFLANNGSGSISTFPIQILIQPKTNSDNLDAMRLMEIELFDSLGNSLGLQCITLHDRRYGVPGTPSSGNNSISIKTTLILSDVGFNGYASPFFFKGYARITLYNAYGPSSQRDYGLAPNTTANWAAGATIPGSSPTGGGGGGGSTYCPDPEALILLDGGSTVRAADLRDGMRVQGLSERDGVTPVVGEVHYAAPELAVMRYLVTLQDGRQMRFSKNHRLWAVAKAEWVAVQDLSPGEEIRGQATCIVASVIEDGPGLVIGFVVEGTHTYFADGLLSHNTKASIP